MKLTEIFAEENVVPDVAATQKREVITELVNVLCESGAVAPSAAKGLVRALMRREELGTTGIGRGVAVPHAKHSGVKGVIGALGRSERGVEFDALDGQPVHLIFLLVSAPDAVEAHLEAMKKVTLLLRNGDFCTFMKRAKGRAELVELLAEADDRLPPA